MKKILFAILLSAVLAMAAAGSEDKSMGAGGWLQAGNHGEHAGLDLQFRESKILTLDIYLHFCFYPGDNALGAYLGYYWNYYLNVPKDIGRMGFYVGPAGGLGWWNVDKEWDHHYDVEETGLAIRLGVVGGYQWEFPVIPLQLYLELNPVGEVHFMWYDIDNQDDDDTFDDDDQSWKLPDVYFRIGLRFWF